MRKTWAIASLFPCLSLFSLRETCSKPDSLMINYLSDFKKKRELTKEERRSNSVIKNHVRLQATLDGRKDEWNKIAHVLNRLFMLLYTSTFLLLTVLLLASAVWSN